jgi:TetR/AcrR family transcriptional regulator, repressor of fatR-cypB operon
MNVHSKRATRTKVVAEEASDKREAMLSAALELFALKGYHGTTVPEIAELARVGAGTVYRYFDNKEALVNELFRHWKGKLFAALMNDFPAEAPARVQFHTVWTRLAEFASKHARALDFLELHHHGEYLDQQSRWLERNLLDGIRAVILKAQKERVFKQYVLPEVLGGLVYGGFMGLVTMARKDLMPLTQKVLDQAEECMWEAISR